MDWKLEVVVIPVSDVDRAKQFYSEKLGFNVDVDHRVGENFRNVQLTPPGSACSVTIGTGLTPGSSDAEWRSPTSSTSRKAYGSMGRAAHGTPSSSSRIRMATTGRCRKSP